MDHGFGPVREGLVVAGQAAVMHEPAEGPLDNPTPRNHLEALLGGIAASDFHINAEAGTMVDDFDPLAVVDDEASEQAVEMVEDRVLLPGGEVPVDGLPRSEVVGQITPGNSGPVDVEDRVHDPAQVVLGRPAYV